MDHDPDRKAQDRLGNLGIAVGFILLLLVLAVFPPRDLTHLSRQQKPSKVYDPSIARQLPPH